MTVADLKQVAANEAAAFPFPWSERTFADCLEAGDECWVATVGGAVIGHGVLSQGAGEAQLLNVCVTPAEQGRGHGRALAARLIAEARAGAAAAVFLEVRASNRVAMTLYADLGFREIGRRPNYYRAATGREDALVMGLPLKPR